MRTIIILMVLSIFSCTQSHEDSLSTNRSTPINIDLNSNNKSKLSEVVDTIKFVPLEQNENCLIRNIDKIDIIGNRIYILDRKSSCIFVFNKSGEFKWKLSKHGRGPEEYSGIGNFDINHINGDIYILDVISKSIKIYNKEGFKRKINNDINPRITGICVVDSNRIILQNKFSSNDRKWKYQFFITDSELNIISKYIPYHESTSMVLSSINPFSIMPNSVSFLPVYHNAIYSINNDNSIYMKYKLDFGSNKMDEEFYFQKTLNPHNFFKLLSKSQKVYQLNFVESPNHLLIYFRCKDQNYLFDYNKTTESGVLIDDFDKTVYNPDKNEMPICTNNDFFVSVTNADNVKNISKHLSHKIVHSEEHKELNNVFVLMLIKLK